jgi:PKHD-type hydroxylase
MKSAKKKLANQTANSAWPFKLDHVNTWAYWESAFTPEECQRIIDIGTGRFMKKGTTGGADKQYVRDSEISWLYSCDDMEWAYRRITDIITNLNDQFFQFDLFGLCEGMQFTRYTAPGGKYGMHIDSQYDGLVRKLSFTLQLSNPADYEGGELCLYVGDEPQKMSRAQGYVAVFPSYVLHEVTPVTAGTRHSLVSWITGPPFK